MFPVQEFRLGELRVRPATRELVGDGTITRLKPRPMDVLVDLARHAGQMRTREDLLDSVWGKTPVSEDVLTHCIWELRQALGDDRREPRFIETLHRGGYRLIAKVESIPGLAETLVESIVESIPEVAVEGDRPLGLLGQRVQRFWIEQVLEKSLGENEALTIDAEERPDLVGHPWAGVTRIDPVSPDDSHALVPAGETILATFERMGRALLITGAVGSGKTVTLLQLARLALERARRDPAAPLPVVLPLASWSERALPLERWVTEEIGSRYFIPRQAVEAWLEEGRLTLLLDGLDEVGPARRSQCMEAIDEFRRVMPQISLAVTCREEDLAASAHEGRKLRLDGAIGLLPLRPSQVSAALEASDAVRELVTSPLLLALARRIESPAPIALDDLIRQLVRDSFDTVDGGYGEGHGTRWLTRLARMMRDHNRTVLAVEELQPSWLTSAWDRVAYVLLTRIVIGACIGVSAGCLLGVLGHSTILFAHMVRDGVAAGLALAAIDGLLLRRRAARPLPSFIYAIVAGSTAALGVLMAHGAFREGFVAAMIYQGLLFALVLARPLDGMRFNRDIGAVEGLTWSWTNALKGWIGTAALTWFLMSAGGLSGWWPAGPAGGAAALSTLPNSFLFALLPALLLGLTPGAVEGKTRPNHGIWLSARNAALSATLALGGAALSVGAGWALAKLDWLGPIQMFSGKVAVHPGLTLFAAVAGTFTPLAALRFGALDVIKHIVLRLLLWREGQCPLFLSHFLEHLTRRGLLRRAGGSYLFFHSTVLNYLADEIRNRLSKLRQPE